MEKEGKKVGWRSEQIGKTRRSYQGITYCCQSRGTFVTCESSTIYIPVLHSLISLLDDDDDDDFWFLSPLATGDLRGLFCTCWFISAKERINTGWNVKWMEERREDSVWLHHLVRKVFDRSSSCDLEWFNSFALTAPIASLTLHPTISLTCRCFSISRIWCISSQNLLRAQEHPHHPLPLPSNRLFLWSCQKELIKHEWRKG